MADCLGIDPASVRLLSPYVGGGFGSKLGISKERVRQIEHQALKKLKAALTRRVDDLDGSAARNELDEALGPLARAVRVVVAAHDERVGLHGADANALERDYRAAMERLRLLVVQQLIVEGGDHRAAVIGNHPSQKRNPALGGILN